MTLRPRAATPVNRPRSLAQVQPLSQFSGLELRNRNGAGPQEKDAAIPQQTDTGMTPSPPKGTSGSEMVNPHSEVGPPEGWRLPDTQSMWHDMRDIVNSDSAAPSRPPLGLGFLGTGGQGSRDMGPVPRIRQLVLSWGAWNAASPTARCRA